MTNAAQNRAIHSLRPRIPGFDEAAYRELLRARFRVVSSRELSEAQAGLLIEELKGLAGQPAGRTSAGRASGKYAPVLQALWLSAHALGAVRDPDDRAMIAFVERQTGLSHTRFLTEHAEARKAIEALKAMLTRAGVIWPAEDDPLLRKRAVFDALARKAAGVWPKFHIEDWLAMANLGPLKKLDGRGLDRAIQRLGAQLRDATKLKEAIGK